jgi:hypothetical protein
MGHTGWLGISIMVFALLGTAPAPAADKMPAAGSVSFLSGGVGIDSEQQIKAREKEFNLKLVFTLVEGNYLADVGVRVTDSAEKTVIEHVAEGPFFLAKLPPGPYTVTATYNGKTQTRKVKVGDRLHTEYLRWASAPGRDVTLPSQSREAAVSTAPRPSPGSTPSAKTGLPFLAGGVGEDAESRLEASQKNFNLKLVFTLVEGNYLADVDVTIQDTAGNTVLEHHVPGPFLLAELPAGTYAVTATYDGKARSRKVRVGNRLSTEYFRWPSDPNTDFTVTRETAARK